MKIQRCLLATLPLVMLWPAGSTVTAQDSAPPVGQRQTDPGLPQINAIDKLLAVEAALNGQKKRTTEEQWAGDYQALYSRYSRDGQLSTITGAGNDEVINAFVLGIKASDAVIALKARNVEALNNAAEQIEQLAVKLGATRKELNMAETVKRKANDGQWLHAFMALGFLERNVLAYLRDNNDPEKRHQAVLIIIGGWIQAGRCVTSVILDNYNTDVSNILREPRMVALMLKEVQQLPPKYQNDPRVKKIAELLPEIRNRVNVGMHDPVKQEDVKWIHEQFDALVQEFAPKGASAAAAIPAGN